MKKYNSFLFSTKKVCTSFFFFFVFNKKGMHLFFLHPFLPAAKKEKTKKEKTKKEKTKKEK
jgi:hypothetical protein